MSAPRPTPRPAPILDTTEYDIVIVAGQSNAVGRGRRNVCDSRALDGCDSIDPRKNSTSEGIIDDIADYDSVDGNKVKMFTCEYDNPEIPPGFNNNSTFFRAHLKKIIPMAEPLDHFVHEYENQISFASSFANEYIRRISMGRKKLLIVGCAASALSIDNWIKNNPSDTDAYHDRTVKRLQDVKNLLSSTNNSKVVAILWHQGESNVNTTLSNDNTISESKDAMIHKRKNEFKFKLKRLLSQMRTDIMGIFINNNSNYKFPILIGGLSYEIEFNRITGEKYTNITNRDRIRDFSILMSEISNPTDRFYLEKSAFVSSYTLYVGGPTYNFNRRLEANIYLDSAGQQIPDKDDDRIHFSASSMREFGKRYFYYFNLIK